MVLGPDGNLPLLVGAYAVGTFFLIGPYAALLFFNSESFTTSNRASAGTLINALGLLGAIIGGALFTATLSAAGPAPDEQASAWIFSGFCWGCVPLLGSALFILLAPRAGQIETSMVGASKDPSQDAAARPGP